MEKHEPMSQDTAGLPTNGHSRPTPLSSNLTLVFRVFLPVFGTVFLTGLLLALLVTNEEEVYLPYSLWWPRAITMAFWVLWLIYVFRVLWRLKRIDADDAHLYVTNYWVTYKYPWTDVERLEDARRLLSRRVVHLWLKAPGRFGQKIVFLPGSHYWEWMREHGKEALLPVN